VLLVRHEEVDFFQPNFSSTIRWVMTTILVTFLPIQPIWKFGYFWAGPPNAGIAYNWNWWTKQQQWPRDELHTIGKLTYNRLQTTLSSKDVSTLLHFRGSAALVNNTYYLYTLEENVDTSAGVEAMIGDDINNNNNTNTMKFIIVIANNIIFSCGRPNPYTRTTKYRSRRQNRWFQCIQELWGKVMIENWVFTGLSSAWKNTAWA
jgi:hypothetical protein